MSSLIFDQVSALLPKMKYARVGKGTYRFYWLDDWGGGHFSTFRTAAGRRSMGFSAAAQRAKRRVLADWRRRNIRPNEPD